MNLTDLIAETRRRLNEVTSAASQYSDTDITKFLNEGIKSMCTLGHVFERTSTTTVTNGIAVYTCPIDFLKAVSLKNPSNVDLDLIEASYSSRVYIVAGLPLYYYVTQTTLLTAVRANNATYVKGIVLIPASANGYMYEVTVEGTTGGSPPTYPTDSGTSVVDGSATITCRELATKIYLFTLVDVPTTVASGTGTYTLTYKAIDEGLYVALDVPNFPIELHPVLCTFAVMRALQMGRQFNDSMIFAKEYAMSIGVDISKVVGGEQA